MATIDLISEVQGSVDEIFKAESKKSLVTNTDYSWTGAHSIKVYKVTTAPMNDYNRNGSTTASRYGVAEDLNAAFEEMTLKNDRSFAFVIDTLDEDETAQALNGASALARQIREVVIPEVDSYVYKTMCEKAGTKPVAVKLTATNIYDKIVEATAALDNAEAPETERCLIVSPTVYQYMKKSKDIVLETDIGEDMRLKGVIANLDGLTVVKVPENRLPANFGFIVCHSVATVAPTKLEKYVTHVDPPGISGTLVEGRICYDAFVLDNKAKAVYYQEQTAE
jgi:hypothetical protein